MNAGDNRLEAWLPRSLLNLPLGSAIPSAGFEGLSPVRLHWRNGHLLAPEPLPDHVDPPEWLVLPRLAEPHVHLDKAFTWASNPNLAGTYEGAMSANGLEHSTRTRAGVLERGDRALHLACSHGLRALRTHIDSVGPGATASWDALVELRERWSGLLDLQLVALVPVSHWSSPEGIALAQRVADVGGLLGGVIGPPYRQRPLRRDLQVLLQLAERSGCGLDLHIDEASVEPAIGLVQLLKLLDQQQVDVPITCSHLSSLGLVPVAEQQRLCERMAEHRVQVVALPLTNAWLLGRRAGTTPITRPLAPIRGLQRAGVRVAVGCDNVADPWFPAGCFDSVALMASCLTLAQLAPWQRLGLAPFTTASAALMNLNWDGVIAEGAPADLLVLKAGSWSEALMGPSQRRILISGQWWNTEAS